MDPMSQIIVINIGNVVAWLAAIYAKDALRGLIGNVIISTLGAFIAAYLSLKLLPEFDKLGMMVAAFLGAGLLLYTTRPKAWQ